MSGARRGIAAIAVAIAACSATETATAPTDAGDEASVVPTCTEPAGPFAPLTVQCGQFYDAQGRAVVLRGVNARVEGVFDVDLGAGKTPLEAIPPLTADDFTAMRSVGFNVLRLPIQWSGVEPADTSPPTYDSAYLDRIAAVVALARAVDLYVLLDFHQDAFSKYIGEDGAPLWAIQPPPDHILQGPLTDLTTRRLSQQVAHASTTFFTVDDPTGNKLRNRFGAMGAAVAKRFKGDTTVVGFELYNEPDATDEQLRNFHAQVGAMLRAEDPTRLLFFEPPAIRNAVDHATIPDGPLPFAGVVYAPHVYTHAFTSGDDSAWKNTFKYADLLPSNQAARDEADGWKSALFIGEFGWDPRGRFSDYIGWQLDAEDATMASSTIWLWKEQSQGSWGFFDHDEATGSWTLRTAVANVFSGRVVPHAIAGTPVRWSWQSPNFALDFQGDPAISTTNRIFVPTGTATATCDGASVDIDRSDTRTRVASIACGGAGAHALRIVLAH